MELDKVLKGRYSVRSYQSTRVEEDKLNKVLDAIRSAPSAMNLQPYKIYVIKSNEGLNKIRSLAKYHYDASIVLMFVVNKDEQWNNPLEKGITSGEQDISIAATQAMLKAYELGLGTVWVGYISPSKIKEAFNLPSNEEVALLMPLGYPSESAKASERHNQRKDLKDLVRYL